MRIDVRTSQKNDVQNEREKEKTEALLDEKDAAYIQQQTTLENLKAEYYHLKLELNEEKQKQHQGSQKAEKEASEIQMQLKQLEDAVGEKDGIKYRTINSNHNCFTRQSPIESKKSITNRP